MQGPSAVVLEVVIFVVWMVGNVAGKATVSPEQVVRAGGDSNTIPAAPVVQQQQNKTCHLDLSDDLFGGVKEACGDEKTVGRSRCCPVLAAWLYAAHARAALAPPPVSSSDLPVPPDDSQTCVNTLQKSLESRGINIPKPNATCDVIQCLCGIRLHGLSSLNCPAAFNLSGRHHNVTEPTPALRALEGNCTKPSHKGCAMCLQTLEKLKGTPGKEGFTERTGRMHSIDCELMGLTWLLAKNKTVYIPTVSAVLRAVMYSSHARGQSECSPDQENMPLALDSVQLYQSAAAAAITPLRSLVKALFSAGLLLLLLLLNGF